MAFQFQGHMVLQHSLACAALGGAPDFTKSSKLYCTYRLFSKSRHLKRRATQTIKQTHRQTFC